jgi:predicted nucleic acid-binding protein
VSYLLDTNVVSALRRKDRAEKRVLDWFESVAGAEFFVSVLTMMEIEIGVRRLELYDRRQAAIIRAWKEGPLEARFRGRFVTSTSKSPSAAPRSTSPTRSRKSTP